MTKQPPITAEVLESICKVIADTHNGLTGSEIGRILADSKIPDTHPSMSKWQRLFNAFANKQNSTNCSNNILTFLQKAMQPVRYVGQNQLFTERLNELNERLSFIGLELTDSGKYRKIKTTSSIPKTKSESGTKPENADKETIKNDLKYDIAISFAGEDRKVAETIAEKLTELKYKVFYDKYEQATLWGKDLYSHLTEIYSKSAKYCLMIISNNYAKKQWTSLERQAAQARAFRQNKEYILPLKLDDTEIPGLNETIGYVDYRKIDIDEIIQLLEFKLKE